MPFIPTIVNQDPAKIGVPQAHATPEEFGAGIGAALEQLGSAVQGFGTTIGAIGAKNQAETDRMNVATAMANNSFAGQYNQIINDHPNADGSGLVPSMSQQYDDYMNAKLAEATKAGWSKKAIDDYHLQLLQDKASYLDKTAGQQEKMGLEAAKQSLDTAAATQLNDIRGNGMTTKDDIVTAEKKYGEKVDSTPGLFSGAKAEFKRNFSSNAAVATLEALRQAAKSPEDYATIRKMLDDPFFKSRLTSSAYDTEAQQIAAQSDRFAQLDAETANNVNVNKTLIQPDKYEENKAAGLKAISETPGLEGYQITDRQNKFKNGMATAYFEGRAMQAGAAHPNDPEAAIKDINGLLKEIQDPKWAGEFQGNDLQQEINTLMSHRAAQQSIYNQQVEASDKAIAKAEEAAHNQFVAKLESVAGRAGQMRIPQTDITELQDLAFKSGSKLTPVEANKMAKIADQVGTYSKNAPLSVPDLHRDNNAVLNRAKGIVWESAPGSGVTGAGTDMILGGSFAGRNIQVIAHIRDGTSLKGMQPRAYQILSGMVDAAERAGVKQLIITAGAGGGHLSHAGGSEWDVYGIQQNGQIWTPAQRVATAQGGRGASADRFGFYEGAGASAQRNGLHIGYSGPGRPSAVWGASGLTGGQASRAFNQAENRDFLSGFQPTPYGRYDIRGGAKAGGGGGFMRVLLGAESGGRNIWN